MHTRAATCKRTSRPLCSHLQSRVRMHVGFAGGRGRHGAGGVALADTVRPPTVLLHTHPRVCVATSCVHLPVCIGAACLLISRVSVRRVPCAGMWVCHVRVCVCACACAQCARAYLLLLRPIPTGPFLSGLSHWSCAAVVRRSARARVLCNVRHGLAYGVPHCITESWMHVIWSWWSVLAANA